MHDIYELKKQMEKLRAEIETRIEKGGIKLTDEVIKISEELDALIHIWIEKNKHKDG